MLPKPHRHPGPGSPFPSLLSAACVAPILLAPAPGARSAPDTGPLPPPNIVLIVIDDIGTENFAWWPQPDVAPATARTDTLAGLAQDGVSFTKCYVQALCSPTRTCLMTGRYAFETGMGSNPLGGDPVPTSFVSIPAFLGLGLPGVYACGAFGKWHMGDFGNEDYRHPIDMGFAHFEGMEANVPTPASTPLGGHYRWTKITAPWPNPRGYELEEINPDIGNMVYDESTYSTSVIRAAARSWIDSQVGPYFAYVAFNAPHAPHEVPPHTLLSTTPPYPAGHAAASPGENVPIYLYAIEALDRELGNLLAGLDLSNTTVIVVGDNGTAKTAVQAPFSSAHAKNSVYDSGTRVPLIVKSPATLPEFRGARCSRLVGAVDFRATIAAIAGAPSSTDPLPSPGVSFLPLIVDPGAPAVRDFAFSEVFARNAPYDPVAGAGTSKQRHERGLTNGRMHLIRVYDPDAADTYEEAYDLLADPFESTNLLRPPTYTPWQLSQIDALRAELDSLSGP